MQYAVRMRRVLADGNPLFRQDSRQRPKKTETLVVIRLVGR